MPAQNIHVITEDFKDLKEASEAFAILQKQFRYMQEHIDVENIIAKSLTADVIKAGSIIAELIAAGAVTADKITVDELSAITAKLGKITSGEIYGTYIATNEGTYPRAEMNNTSKHFRAMASSNIFTEIASSFGGAPALHSTDGITTGIIQTFSFLGGSFLIASNTDIDIKPGSASKISIPSWDQLYSGADAQTLATALNNLATSIDNAAKKGISTGASGGHNHGIPNGTSLMVSGGGTVTWSAASSHTHEQS